MPTHLNPMVFYPRFQHITEQIFEHLDKQSLKDCRVVSKSWQESIDNKNILWTEVFKKSDCNNAFQSSCKNGRTKIAKFLMKKSIEFKIDLNARDNFGDTAFHKACKNGHSKIAEMFIQKSAEFNIELNTKDEYGKTAFHYACEKGYSKIAEMFIQKSAEFNIELNTKDKIGKTAFHYACAGWGTNETVEIMIKNAKSFQLDLTAKDDSGETGFQLAQHYKNTDIINLIKRAMPNWENLI